MLPPALLEGERKSCAIWYVIFRQSPKEKAPAVSLTAGALDKALAVTYFHMGRPHTIIGDTPFHF